MPWDFVITQAPKDHCQGTSRYKDCLEPGAYCNQTGDLTAEYVEVCGEGIND